MESDEVSLIREMRSSITSHMIEKASVLQDLTQPFSGEVRFVNQPKQIKVDDAPDSMTIKEVKELNESAKLAKDYIDHLRTYAKIYVDDDDSIYLVAKKEHPELSHDEFRLVMSHARDLWRFDSDWIQNVSQLIELAVGLKQLQ